jgi:hypothetical protein
MSLLRRLWHHIRVEYSWSRLIEFLRFEQFSLSRRFARAMKRSHELSPQAFAQMQAVEMVLAPRAKEHATYQTWRVWHHKRYNGSPIPIRLSPGDCFLHERLYLGPSYAELGVEERPDVDAIVNLCEMDDPWPLCDDDKRWWRGEGPFGYTWSRLIDDALPVVELLRADKRVLIHCMAGVNRSSTLTCAALMYIEGIGAREALQRVQRFHPMAHPDEYHWRALRQLEIVLREEREQQNE